MAHAELKRGNHSVYSLTYHVVFVVKYRRKCITPEIGDYLVREASRLLGQWDGELLEGKADRDHLHLLIGMNPKYELARYMGVLKQTLAHNVRRDFGDEIRRTLHGDSFWTDSYFISSTGGAPLEQIRKYIEEQGRPKRKYTKHGK